jgi:hypothetical protein
MDPIEPAINIPQENAACILCQWFEVTRPLGSISHGNGAPKSTLPVGGHNG